MDTRKDKVQFFEGIVGQEITRRIQKESFRHCMQSHAVAMCCIGMDRLNNLVIEVVGHHD
jgi:hypothetical protein